MTTVSLKSVLDDLAKLPPTPPFRWLLRSSDLTPDQERALDSLMLPDRYPPTRYLPPGVVAVLFEEAGDDWKMTLIQTQVGV